MTIFPLALIIQLQRILSFFDGGLVVEEPIETEITAQPQHSQSLM